MVVSACAAATLSCAASRSARSWGAHARGGADHGDATHAAAAVLSRPNASRASACLNFAVPSFRKRPTLNQMSLSVISSRSTYSGSLASFARAEG